MLETLTGAGVGATGAEVEAGTDEELIIGLEPHEPHPDEQQEL